MNSGIIRIQKGYLLIEKAKDTIKSLYETQEIKFDKDQLSLMREKEELINNDINEVKNKVFEYEEEIQKIEKEIATIIKKSFNNQKRDPKKVLEINSRKEDLEEKKSEFKREIMVLFLQMDALKEQMQNHKLMYNDMEKKDNSEVRRQNYRDGKENKKDKKRYRFKSIDII